MADLVYGRRPVLEALRSGVQVYEILLAAGAQPHGTLATILRLAEERGVPIRRVEKARLDALVRHHQGVVAYVEAFKYAELETCLELAARRGEPALLLALDEIQDVQNMGTLIRTAEAVGAHGVLLPRHRTAPITPAVRKASAGAVEHIPIVQVVNLHQALMRLKQADVWIVGLDMAGDQPYDAMDWTLPCTIVVGSEGHGLRRLIRETCDFLVCLPMRGRIASLNAAVAGSIVLYTAWRYRMAHSV